MIGAFVDVDVVVVPRVQYEVLRLGTRIVPDVTTFVSGPASRFATCLRLAITNDLFDGAVSEQSPSGALLYATIIEPAAGAG